MKSLTFLSAFSTPKSQIFISTATLPTPPFILAAVRSAAREAKTPSPKRSSKSTKTLSPMPASPPSSTTIPTSSSTKKVLVPIGYGTEEMEAVILVDVLRRAGAEVTLASVEPQLEVEASGGTRLVADTSISDCTNEIFDLIALPLMSADEENSRRKELNEVQWSFDHNSQVLIPVANGSEEIEVVTFVDILRRAKVNVLVASVEKSTQILASQGTKIVADKLISAAAESIYDLIILPGGTIGAERLQRSKVLKKLLKEQKLAGRKFGAVCSSLSILQRQGLVTVGLGSIVSPCVSPKHDTVSICTLQSQDKKATAHPSVSSELNDIADGARVVIDGNLITGKGLATAADFALAIVSKLFGHARARSVAEGLVFEYPRS